MVTSRACSIVVLGTKLPAKRPAATMRGSTAASRTPMAVTPPEIPAAGHFGQREQGVEDCLPLRNGLLDQRKDEPVDDVLVRPLPGPDRLTQLGTRLLDSCDARPVAAPGQFDARCGETQLCGVPCSSLQPGVHRA